MLEVTSPVTTIGEFQHDDHFIAVVWLPLPNFLLVQIAGPAEVGRLPFEIFAYITQPSKPQLEHNALYAGQWPLAGSEAEEFVMARAVEIYETEVPTDFRSGQKRPVFADSTVSAT